MISVSNDAKTAIANGIGLYGEIITITLKDGTVLNLTEENIWTNGITCDNSIATDDFPIGSAAIGACNIVIIDAEETYRAYNFDDATVNVQLTIPLDEDRETGETIQKGFYTVNSTEYNGFLITLKCYNNMSKFDVPYSDVETTYPATILQIVQGIALHCGVTLLSSTFDGNDIEITVRPRSEGLTCRQVLAFIGQRIASHVTVDTRGRLKFVRPNFDYTAVDHEISSVFSQTAQVRDVTITGIKVIEQFTAQNGEKLPYYMSGSEGYVLEVSKNLLIYRNKGSAAADYIGAVLNGKTVRPLRATILNDPTIEVGDSFSLTDYKGAVYYGVVTSVRFQTGQSTQIECTAKSLPANAVTRMTETQTLIQEAEEKSTASLNAYEQQISLYKQLAVNAIGAYITEETQQDGSIVYYEHDKRNLSESTYILKRTADGYFRSSDGGQTWNSGWDAEGNAAFNLLSVVGLSADWIQTGVISDKNGTNYINLDTGVGQIGGWTVNSYGIYKNGTTQAGMSVNDSKPAFWAGDSYTHAETAPFHVGHDGALYASSGSFGGSLDAATGTFAGELSAATGTFSGDLSAAGGTFSGDLQAAGGTFTGTLSGVDGTFSGSLNAATGTFAGELVAATGSFSGSVTASTGQIGGWFINSGGLSSAASGGSIHLRTSGNILEVSRDAALYAYIDDTGDASFRDTTVWGLNVYNGDIDITSGFGQGGNLTAAKKVSCNTFESKSDATVGGDLDVDGGAGITGDLWVTSNIHCDSGNISGAALYYGTTNVATKIAEIERRLTALGG